MPKIAYKDITFRGASLDTIQLVNKVIEEYEGMGYDPDPQTAILSASSTRLHRK